MEFRLHTPLELETEGILAQQWKNFLERFQLHRSANAEQPSHSPLSILLFAAHHRMDKISADLREQGIDPAVTSKVLEVVEDACLPHFLLLFERFRYFSREQFSSETVSEYAQFLRRQVDYCQFGALQDSIQTSALINGINDEPLREKLLQKGTIHFEEAVNVCNVDVKQNIDLDDIPLAPSPPEQGRRGPKRKAKFSAQESKEKELYMVPVDDDENEDADLDNAKLIINNYKKVSKIKKKKQKPKKNNAVSRGLAKPKIFKCFACSNEYRTRKSFRRHIQAKHPTIKKFHCMHCNIKFENRRECLNHCLGHGKIPYTPGRHSYLKSSADASYMCWYCGERLPNLADYKEHNTKHSQAVRVYTCDICQKKNHNISRMIGHLKGHLIPRHKCEVCGNCFGKPELLVAHLQAHVDKPNHQCLVCGKSFVTADRLHCHMRTHSGEKRFTCELCGKCFSQKMSFDYHKRWHAGEKPYECDICGRRTICYGDLKKHKRMHSDKRPYVCEVCGKSFRFISNLNRHRKGHTGKRLYVCQVCGRSFIYNEGLRDHIKAGRCPGMKSEGGAGGKSSNRGPRPRNSSAIVSLSMMNLAMGATSSSSEVPPPPPVQAQPIQTPTFTSKTILSPVNLSTSLAPAVMAPAPAPSSTPSPSSTLTPLHHHHHHHHQQPLPLPSPAALVQVPAPPHPPPGHHITHVQHGAATALQETYMTEFAPWQQYMIRNNIAVTEGGEVVNQPGSNVVIVPQFY